jgi:glycosyltransferase involved in cell wall biosynthesis
MREAATCKKKPKLLFVVTEDWYFCSHRLPLAVSAINAGFDVAIATRITNHRDVIQQAGVEVYPWNVSRGSTNVFTELKALFGLLKIYWKVRPDLVHQVALKPVLYGSFIAKLIGPKKVINALGGMGFVFNDGRQNTRRLRSVILTGFKWLLSGKDRVLILQNPEDCALMVKEAGIDADSIRLIRGAGVNIQQFDVSAEPNGTPIIILPARMLWDKGIGEYVEAAKILKAEGVAARLILVGGIDECNPAAISPDQLHAWADAGYVEWFGQRDDMPEVFRQANVVCLPSYREGLPKALLEAAACGRAIVASDVPGCREIVKSGENGILVPARDPVALAIALKQLISSPDLRRQMGLNGRNMVIEAFSEEAVAKGTLYIYKKLSQKSC